MRTASLTLLALAFSLPAMAFELSSPDIKQGQALTAQQEFNSFGCNGANISPALAWNNAPAGTKSYAVTVYDPDAPTGSGWWHWTVFNIPASAKGLPAGAGNVGGVLPAGAVQGRTDFGASGYGGACPPKGDTPHRYRFTVHALKVEKLDLNADSMPALLGFMLHDATLGKAVLQTTYARP